MTNKSIGVDKENKYVELNTFNLEVLKGCNSELQPIVVKHLESNYESLSVEDLNHLEMSKKEGITEVSANYLNDFSKGKSFYLFMVGNDFDYNIKNAKKFNMMDIIDKVLKDIEDKNNIVSLFSNISSEIEYIISTYMYYCNVVFYNVNGLLDIINKETEYRDVLYSIIFGDILGVTNYTDFKTNYYLYDLNIITDVYVLKYFPRNRVTIIDTNIGDSTVTYYSDEYHNCRETIYTHIESEIQ